MTSYRGKQADPGLYFHCLRTALGSYDGRNFRRRHLKPRKCGAVADSSDQGTNTTHPSLSLLSVPGFLHPLPFVRICLGLHFETESCLLTHAAYPR